MLSQNSIISIPKYLELLRQTLKPMKLRFLNPSVSSLSINYFPVSTVKEKEIENTAVCKRRSKNPVDPEVIVSKSMNSFLSWWIDL